MASRDTFFLQTHRERSATQPQMPCDVFKTHRLHLNSIVPVVGCRNVEDKTEDTGVKFFPKKATRFQEVLSTTIAPYSMREVLDWNAPRVERAAPSAGTASEVSTSRE